MTYKLNFRFLIKFVIVLAVLLGGVHFWHRHQASKQVEQFLRLADAAKEKQPDVEMRYLARYLALRPNDIDVRERLGRLRYKHAKTRADATSAFLILEEALRRDASRLELRRHIVDVALDPRLQLAPEAAGHLKVLMESNPNDGELHRLRGFCHEVADELVEAGSKYEKALQLNPDNVDAYVQLAFLIRRVNLKDPATANGIKDKLQHEKAKDKSVSPEIVADAVIDDLVGKNPKSFRAFLAAANYWRFYGKPEQVRTAIETAYRINPERQETILARAALDRENTGILASITRLGPDLARPLASARLRDARMELRTLLDHGLTLELPAQSTEKETKLFRALLPRLYQARADVELDDNKLDDAEAVLLKGTESVQEPADLWWSLADVRIRRNDKVGARQAIEELTTLSTPKPLTDYLLARIDVLDEKWVDAANRLSLIQDDLKSTNYYKPANFLLARCYEQIGELDRRTEAFNRVLADKDVTGPLWLPATLGLAEARTALGQYEAALEIYQSIVNQHPGAWLAIARIRMNQALQQAEENRDLRPVEDAVNRAARVLAPDHVDLVLIQSDLAFLKKDNAGARKQLTDLLQKRDKSLEVWIALAVQDLRDKDGAQAAATLASAKQKLGDSATLRLAQARLLIDPKSPGAAEQLKALAPKETDTFSKTDQLRLSRGLAALASGTGDSALAGQLWNQAADLAPHDLGVQLRRFDRAQQAGDTAEIDKVLAKIREIDGKEGTSYKAAEAMYYLRIAQKDPTNTKALNDAGARLDQLETERPSWSRVALGQAVVADMRKEFDKALERYQKSVELGERDPTIIRRMIELLAERSRFTEAQAALDKLPQEFLGTAEMSRLATEICLLSDNPGQALNYATRAIKPDSDDYRDQLWAARVYWNARATDKWEAPARKAVSGAKGDPIPLITLVEMLVASGRSDDAKKALTEFGETVAADQRSFAKARCLHLVGRRRDAEEFNEAQKHFEQACKDRPDDVRVFRAFADYLMEKGDITAARVQFERINDLRSASDIDKKMAKTMIALCAPLDRQLDYASARQALAGIGLLDGDRLKDPDDGAKPEDLRAAATVLALQVDRASKVQAIRYLDKLETLLRQTGRPLSATDHFLRGQLHASLNEPEAARRHLLRALVEDPKNALALSYYVLFVIRQNQPALLSEGERWLKNLKEVQPNASRTAELEARMAVAQKNTEEAKRILKAQESKPDAQIRRLAGTYEEIGLFDDAGRLYKELGDQSKRPEALLIYAAFLGRQKQTEKALDRCDEARAKGCSVLTLTEAGVLILYDATSPRPNEIGRVLSWVTEGLAASSAQAGVTSGLLNQQAAIFNLQGKYDDAIAVYERLLSINARDSLAMNNLGYLLAAHKRDFAKAFSWLVRAKGINGPLPEFLDTEALIHLARGKAENAPAGRLESAKAALKLLGDVEVQAPSGVTYFHLSLAKLAADDPVGAKLAWAEANERNLSIAELHPLERSDYERLRAQFGDVKKGPK